MCKVSNVIFVNEKYQILEKVELRTLPVVNCISPDATRLQSKYRMEYSLLLNEFTNKLDNSEDSKRVLNFNHQQHVNGKLKLSKLLDGSNVSITYSNEEIDPETKDEHTKIRVSRKPAYLKGSRFLMIMQAHAKERRMKSEEARKRREAIEREREEIRLAAEEKERLILEEEKRHRIKVYWRKRREEKELEIKKQLDRNRYVAQMEIVEAFNQNRLEKQVMNKFKNIIKYKIRTERAAHKMSLRIIYRSIFTSWRDYTASMIEERKIKNADEWYQFRVKEHVFGTWMDEMLKSRLVLGKKLQKAEAHFNWYLKWKALEHWRCLYEMNKIEEECETRRHHWKTKLKQLIPHFSSKLENLYM